MIAFRDETRRQLDGLIDPATQVPRGTASTKPELPSRVRARVRVVRDAVDAFYQRDQAAHTALEALEKNDRLTAAGKEEPRKAIREGWRGDGPALAEAVMAAVRDANDRESFAFRYPEGWPSMDIGADETARQAILANARSDARMLLDAVKNDYEVVPRMAGIAEHGDADVAYLLLATSWAVNYLRSRFPGAQTPVLDWEQKRVRLAPRFLGERDGEAWLALGRIAYPLYSVAGLVRQDLHYANQELGIVGGPLPEMVDAPEAVA